MSFKNPTLIHLGQTATYGGLNWRVLGRVVLGVVEDGEIYHWNEFNLLSETGETATLVFERTERGAEWRWFTQFEPQTPLTAAEAATKVLRDRLNLEGTDVRVTLVETSRIYYIEGQAPPGEEVGSEASYFNAERGDKMLVVSWTGEEVEYYRGRTITSRAVRQAFNLDTDPGGVTASPFNPLKLAGGGGNSWAPALTNLLVIGIILFVVMLFFKGVFLRPGTGITRIGAPPVSLQIGSTGTLAGEDYHITGHVQLALAEVNVRMEYHEYYLRDRQGNEAVLLAGWLPHDPDWVLFTPLHPQSPLTPNQAGAVRLGEVVDVAGLVVPVDELFTTTVEAAEFNGPSETSIGETFYGFAGERNQEILLASWNETGVTFWQGQKLLARTVVAAFGPTAGH